MSVDEIFELYYKANEECIECDKIDKELYEEEKAHVKEYESHPNHGVGEYGFHKGLNEIYKKFKENNEHYVRAAEEYNKARKMLLEYIVEEDYSKGTANNSRKIDI